MPRMLCKNAILQKLNPNHLQGYYAKYESLRHHANLNWSHANMKLYLNWCHVNMNH